MISRAVRRKAYIIVSSEWRVCARARQQARALSATYYTLLSYLNASLRTTALLSTAHNGCTTARCVGVSPKCTEGLLGGGADAGAGDAGELGSNWKFIVGLGLVQLAHDLEVQI